MLYIFQCTTQSKIIRVNARAQACMRALAYIYFKIIECYACILPDIGYPVIYSYHIYLNNFY